MLVCRGWCRFLERTSLLIERLMNSRNDVKPDKTLPKVLPKHWLKYLKHMRLRRIITYACWLCVVSFEWVGLQFLTFVFQFPPTHTIKDSAEKIFADSHFDDSEENKTYVNFVRDSGLSAQKTKANMLRCLQLSYETPDGESQNENNQDVITKIIELEKELMTNSSE